MTGEPEERSRRERMLVLAARQQALAEVLLQIRRLIGSEAPDSAEPDHAYYRLKAGWLSLHAWLEEAGRESCLELRLLRVEPTQTFEPESPSPWTWLRSLIRKR